MQKYLKNIFLLLVCLSVCAPIFVFKDLLFPFVTGKAFFFRICIQLAAPLYVYLLVLDKKLRPNLKNPLTICVLAFLLINFISSFTGVSVIRSIWGNFERMGGAFYLLHLTALYFYLLLLGQMQGSYLQSFLKFLLFSALIVTVNGIFGWLHLPVLVQDPSLPSRVSSTLGNPIYLGSFLIIPFYLALFFGRGAESKPRALGYYFLGFIFLAGIFLSGTRGALVGLIAGSFISALAFLFLSSNKKIKLYGFVLVGIFAIASAGLFVFNNRLPQGSTLKRIFTLNDSNTSARLVQWKIALSGYKDRPLLGTGPENYYIVANQYYNPEIAKFDRSWFDKPHNYILEILVTNGAFGLLAYLSMLLFMVIALHKGYRAGLYGVAEFCFLLAALLAYQIQNLTVFDTVPAGLMFYAFVGFAGYIWSVSGTEQKSENKNVRVNISQAASFLPIAAAAVAVIVVAYTIYVTEALPLAAAKNVNYGFAYASVDPVKALDYFNKAVASPFNFDMPETAGKLSEFAGGFARRAGAKDFEQAQKTLEAAIAATNQALEIQPNNPILWERLASNYLYKGLQPNGQVALDSRVEDALQKAISLAPRREEGYIALAQIRALQGNNSEAEKLLKNAIEAFPTDPNAKLQLASLYRAQNKLDEAVSLVQQAQSQGYAFGSYGEIQWLVQYYSQKKEFNNALDLVRQGAGLEPNNLAVFVDMVHLLVATGQYDEARSLAENIIKYDKTKEKEMQALIDSLSKASTSTPVKE